MDKVAIIYIGERETKRIDYAGKNYIFPKDKKVFIPSDAAYYLLQFDDVFADEETYEERMKQIQEANEQAELKAKLAEEALKKELSQETFLVFQNSPEQENIIDISKYTTSKLTALALGQELEIDVDKEPTDSDVTKVQFLRGQVRNALHEKFGNPVELFNLEEDQGE